MISLTTTDDTLDQALDPELEALTPADPASIAPDGDDRPDDTFEPDPTSKQRPDSGLGLLHRIHMVPVERASPRLRPR